jgi:hypothetical protein
MGFLCRQVRVLNNSEGFAISDSIGSGEAVTALPYERRLPISIPSYGPDLFAKIRGLKRFQDEVCV